MPDANQLLREDHRKVKELFREFERTPDKRRKREIAHEAIRELDIHTQIEEKIYYPAVQGQDDDANELVIEAEEEHHVVDTLANELKRMRTVNDEFEAKFKVMAENVKHHIEEEEMRMLPMAAEEGMDRLRELGEEMHMEKARLMGAARRKPASANGRRRTTSRARTTGTTKKHASPSNGRRRTTASTNGRKRVAAKRTSSGTRTSRSRSAATRTKASKAGGTLTKSRGTSPRTTSAGRTLASKRRTTTSARMKSSRSSATRSGHSRAR